MMRGIFQLFGTDEGVKLWTDTGLHVTAQSWFSFHAIISLISAVLSQCFVQDGNQVTWGHPLYLFVSQRSWTRQRTTGRGSCRLQPRPSGCGSSKSGRWRPSTTPSTSATSTWRRSVWSPRCGVPSPIWTPSSSLCVGGRWVTAPERQRFLGSVR